MFCIVKRKHAPPPSTTKNKILIWSWKTFTCMILKFIFNQIILLFKSFHTFKNALPFTIKQQDLTITT